MSNVLTTKPKYVVPEYVGLRETKDIVVEHIVYDDNSCTRHTDTDMHLVTGKRNWFLVKGLNNQLPDMIKHFDIGNIALTAILNTQERPHALNCEQGLGIAATYFNLELREKKISIWTNFKAVVSFQDSTDDLFLPLIIRMGNPDSLTRKENAERLFVALIDFLVDLYYPVLDILDERLNELEKQIYTSNSPASLIKECREIKLKLNHIYSAIYTMHPIVENILEDSSGFTTKTTEFAEGSIAYAKDVLLHIDHIVDKLTQYKSNASNLVDLCIALNSTKMNEVLKFLTILSTIFLPTSFLASVWGMNFIEPEIKWEYGYLYAWSVFLLLSILQVLWFRKKKWW